MRSLPSSQSPRRGAGSLGARSVVAATLAVLVAMFAVPLGCTSPSRAYGPNTAGSGAQPSGAGGATAGTGGESSASGGGGQPTGPGAPGSMCSSGSACKSGFCVDGVCCNGACTSACHACSAKLTGAVDGDCAPVVGGSDPHADCPDDGVMSCGRTGSCSAQGACAFYPAGSQCSAQTCSGSTKTLAMTCDGSGACMSNGTVSCGAKMCAGNVCSGDCASDASCASGQYCDIGSGQCLAKLAGGSPCQASMANQCTSGFCADGVCCDMACTGGCNACTKALNGGADGTCGPAPSGTNPHGSCTDKGVASCGTNGTCDGMGACADYAAGTVCTPGSCAAGTETNASTCDGHGTCVNNGTTACAPFPCAGAVCASNCTSDAQCGSAKWCNAGACVAKQGNGPVCSAADQCTSGFCVDGVCCDMACTGTCQACSVALKGQGSNGTCGPIVAGATNSQCTDQGSASCGTDGKCDGAGACQKYSSGTACGATSCAGHVQTNGGTCNGAGVCATGGNTDCTPYVCGATACKTTCTSAADCVSGYTCSSGACVMLSGIGVSCSSGAQCLSGACVDGVCCNASCGATCQACSAATKGSGADGICGPVASGTDPNNQCTDQGAASCMDDGFCDGAGACALYASGTPCAGGSCSGGTQVAPSTCNGSGACVGGASSPCGAYVCGGTACKTSCASAGDCASGYICSGTSCVPPLTQGAACTSASQCATGFCAQGFCCNTSCTGTCKSCDGSQTDNGIDGTCGNISCPLKGGCGGTLHCQNGACTTAACL